MRPADHRFGICHGFQKHKAKTFTPAGQGEHVTVCVAGKKLLRRETVEKVCMFRNSEIAGESVPALAGHLRRRRARAKRPARLSGHAARAAIKVSAPLYRSAGSHLPTVRMIRARSRKARRRRGRNGRCKARLKFRVKPPGEPLDFAGKNMLLGNQMLHGVRARPNDQIRAAERGAARPAERLPHFDAVGEDHRPKFPRRALHGPHDREPDADEAQSPGPVCGPPRAAPPGRIESCCPHSRKRKIPASQRAQCAIPAGR